MQSARQSKGKSAHFPAHFGLCTWGSLCALGVPTLPTSPSDPALRFFSTYLALEITNIRPDLPLPLPTYLLRAASGRTENYLPTWYYLSHPFAYLPTYLPT